MNKMKIVSCYYENLKDTNVPLYQKKVFDKFNINLEQHCISSRHSSFIDEVLRKDDSDIYCFFDVDCIPLVPNFIDIALDRLFSKQHSILGIEQQCNCNDSNNFIYCGPACFLITNETYNILGKPSAKETYRADVIGEFTYSALEKNVDTLYFKKTSSENNLWKLGENDFFGHGTIYENILYHQFEISTNIDKFINKCVEVINE